MGETVEFASNGTTASGYLAPAISGSGHGVIVVQEWWGLVPQIKRVCDSLAEEGFTALAPDLYHGQVAAHDEMDKAGRLMSELPPDRAARDMSGAVSFLLDHPASTGTTVGAVGFCMGGMLVLLLAVQEGDRIGAAVPYYGAPLQDEPDWSDLSAPVLGHFAEKDDFFPADAIKTLESKLRSLGKDVTFDVYPGTGHAFGNEEDALGTHDAEATELAWTRTLRFLDEKLRG
jgi:carboxymethylenebutenolidase